MEKEQMTEIEPAAEPSKAESADPAPVSGAVQTGSTEQAGPAAGIEEQWYRSEGSCKACNLKGYIRIKENMSDDFKEKMCDCLRKTLMRKGVIGDYQYAMVNIEGVKTMIARKLSGKPGPAATKAV